jgi:uncharacterized protein (TIGR03032 family)
LTNSLPNQAELIQCHVTDEFQTWLTQMGGAIAITTYQSGKVALVGWDGQQVTLLLRQFTKPMGLAVQEQQIALATQHEVLLLANAPQLAHNYLEQQPGRYDALYLPRVTYFTGDLNIHDLAFGRDRLWFVNTRFSCLANLDSHFNFVPVWQPPFISEIVPEDRCHLNGLALVADQPKFVTALGESDQVGGWRSTKATGGILIDVEQNEVILRGLSMPHSPCWHDHQLWLLNSGAGELWRVEPSGQHQVICTLPGFLRGLCCVGEFAIVGLSQIREQHIFGGLPVQQRFDRLKCGVVVVNLNSGKIIGSLEFTHGCQEIYDVKFLPGVQRPALLNLERPATRQAFTTPDCSYWLRPSAEMIETC